MDGWKIISLVFYIIIKFTVKETRSQKELSLFPSVTGLFSDTFAPSNSGRSAVLAGGHERTVCQRVSLFIAHITANLQIRLCSHAIKKIPFLRFLLFSIHCLVGRYCINCHFVFEKNKHESYLMDRTMKTRAHRTSAFPWA